MNSIKKMINICAYDYLNEVQKESFAIFSGINKVLLIPIWGEMGEKLNFTWQESSSLEMFL